MASYTEKNNRRTPEYRAWDNMIQRCYNDNYIRSQNYKSRGITVCERWRNSYDKFLEDMGERPGDNYSLDRIDNDGNYKPSNCRWATRAEQMANSRAHLNSKNPAPGVSLKVTSSKEVKYEVRHTIAGKGTYLGRFSDIDEAMSLKFFCIYAL